MTKNVQKKKTLKPFNKDYAKGMQNFREKFEVKNVWSDLNQNVARFCQWQMFSYINNKLIQLSSKIVFEVKLFYAGSEPNIRVINTGSRYICFFAVNFLSHLLRSKSKPPFVLARKTNFLQNLQINRSFSQLYPIFPYSAYCRPRCCSYVNCRHKFQE